MGKSQPMQCNNGCNTEIYFDDSVRSERGRKIPLEVKSGEKHQCPNSEYNKRQKEREEAESHGKKISEIEDKITELEKKLEELSKKVETNE